jgi:hypothetical protein
LIGAYASLVVVAVASVAVGVAVLRLVGRPDAGRLAGPIGLAALLVAAGLGGGLTQDATGAAAALVALVLGAVAVLVSGRLMGDMPPELATRPWSDRIGPALAALLAVLVASLPFIVAGRVGILGVGLVNDDMANHLLLASWLDERFSPEPVLVDQGYPLGPHALVAGLARALGTDPVNAFAGLTLAVPALTALVAFGALEGLGRAARTLAAAATALPYLVSAYLAQGAFKEPIMALFLLGFALLLPRVRGARDALPLGLVAAGSVYVYSFPGLVWLAGTAAVWAAIELAGHRDRAGALLRAAAAPAAVAVAVGLALVAPDLGRVLDFADFRALDPDRANEGGLGNLRGHLSPLAALGVWPTSEFRLAAGAGSLPAIAFYAGAALGAAALALGLPRWLRRHGPAVPAALLAAALVYVAARSVGTVYTSAKALAIASPLIALIALGGLLEARRASRTALAAAFVLLAALSSFLVLRQAPVGPEDHGNELAQIRPLVQGERLLFLGRDNFVLYELRGSKPFTHVRNFYNPYFVRPNFALRDVASKFDFDSVEARKLARFPYVVTTRAAYASGAPPGYEPALATPSYVLWRRGDDPATRRPVERGPEPTGELPCGGRPPARARVALAWSAPVRVEAGGWSATTIEDGSPATIPVDLPAGEWALSLQYDSTRPVTLSGPAGEIAKLPGNLDYRGVAPFWPAGVLESRGEPIEIIASVQAPGAAGRLLGAHSTAHLGAIGATGAPPAPGAGLEPPYPGLGQRLTAARPACGREADWIEPASP